MENNYHRTIYIDIETVGLKISDPIIEVAAVAVETGTYRVIDTIDMKIEFAMKEITNFKALGVNKFSAEEWTKYALPSKIAAEKMALFFSQYATIEKTSRKGNPYTVAKLAGHNANVFDTPRLKHWFKKHELFFPAMMRTLCTEQKARWVFEDNPDLQPPKNYQLGTLIEHLSLESQPDHTALADTLATVDLARALAEFTRISCTTEKPAEAA